MSETETSSNPIFYSIPTEVFEKILEHVDKVDALSLALASPRLIAIAEPVIWRSLQLSLPPRYGTLPLVQPAEITGRRETELWANTAAREAEERHRKGIAKKVEAVSKQGNESRWKMVREIGMVPRPTAIKGMLQIVQACAPDLQRLEVQAPAENTKEAAWRPQTYEELDYHLLRDTPHFPSLTHLVLGPSAIEDCYTVLLITVAAPNLVSLDVDMQHRLPRRLRHDALPERWPEVTKLEQLRFICSDGEDTDDEDSIVLLNIIQASPSLVRLATDFQPGPGYGSFLAIARHPLLRDLYLPFHPSDIESFEAGDSHINAGNIGMANAPDFGNIQRAVLDIEGFDTMICYVPHFSALQILYYDPKYLRHQRIPLHDPSYALSPNAPLIAHSMIPHFADNIRETPHLRAIHYLPDDFPSDDLSMFPCLLGIEAVGDFTGRVCSYRHGDDELLHVRILIPYSEIEDSPSDDPDADGTDLPDTVFGLYYDGIEGPRGKMFARLAEPAIYHMTDLNGQRVPLEVIEQMRVVEGLEREAWGKRGVKVGEAGWQVLLDWRERGAASECGG